MKIVCVSDTHSFHDKTVVPDGDILIHAGDLTAHGDLADVEALDSWLAFLPHRHKIVICGNHDFCFQEQMWSARAMTVASRPSAPPMMKAMGRAASIQVVSSAAKRSLLGAVTPR